MVSSFKVVYTYHMSVKVKNICLKCFCPKTKKQIEKNSPRAFGSLLSFVTALSGVGVSEYFQQYS